MIVMARRFNPSVGILGVQAIIVICRGGRPGQFQSLSRDSGCSSSKEEYDEIPEYLGFNPSVGILGVQALSIASIWFHQRLFQSLSRDSGCSSVFGVIVEGPVGVVSIPQSGFWVFKRLLAEVIRMADTGFNPSVGILGVQATSTSQVTPRSLEFQSLSRDSGCSSFCIPASPFRG